MDVTLLLNPSAGRGGHAPDQLRQALEAEGHRVVGVFSTKRRQLPHALEDPGELVVVAGGDGAVGRVMKALAGRGVPIAIIPLGTANNIATSLGIRGTPAELARRWPTARRQRVDVGTARGPWGEIPFVESVGIGLIGLLLSAEVQSRIEDNATARETARRFARSMPALRRRVELDGEDLSGEYLLLEAMNIRCAGPNLCFADRVRPGDGRLEVVMAKETERATLVDLPDVSPSGVGPAALPTRLGRRVRVWCELRELHVDDEHGAELHEARGMVEVEAELGDRGVEVLV